MRSVHLPSSLDALWPLLDDPQARVMAGGTDLLVGLRAGLPAGPICCLERIPALRGVSVSGRIVRIGAACEMNGTSYSKFMGGLKKANVDLDRKILADLAVSTPEAFTKLVTVAKG